MGISNRVNVAFCDGPSPEYSKAECKTLPLFSPFPIMLFYIHDFRLPCDGAYIWQAVIDMATTSKGPVLATATRPLVFVTPAQWPTDLILSRLFFLWCGSLMVGFTSIHGGILYEKNGHRAIRDWFICVTFRWVLTGWAKLLASWDINIGIELQCTPLLLSVFVSRK